MNIDKLRRLATEMEMDLRFYDDRGLNHGGGKRDPKVVRAEGNIKRYLYLLYEAYPRLKPKNR